MIATQTQHRNDGKIVKIIKLNEQKKKNQQELNELQISNGETNEQKIKSAKYKKKRRR